MAEVTQERVPLELLEVIETQMKELRQAENLEAQIREMVAAKRERVLALWRRALAEHTAPALHKTSPAANIPAADPIAEAAPKGLEGRPFGAPGAPRDLLAQSGASAAASLPGAGASALLRSPLPQRKTAVEGNSHQDLPNSTTAKAPSPQQVFQSLNRLVGGAKESLRKQ